jgi:hypothetical protein
MRSSERRRSRLEAALDRAEVRERAAEPAVRDVELAGALRFFGNDVRGLALGADEQHMAAARDRVGEEVERPFEQARGLIEIDDVDAAARAVNELAHLRIPALGLMAEVGAGFEELADRKRILWIARLAAEITRRAFGGEHRRHRRFDRLFG